MREKLKGLYGITDPHYIPDSQLAEKVRAALQGGMGVLQYRNKYASYATKLTQAQQLKALCDEFGALFIINDDLALCLDVHASGLHIGQTDGNAHTMRQALGPEKLLGITCHNDIRLAHEAIAKGADYVAFGSMFASRTKPKAPRCSFSVLAQAAGLAVPVVAIGGITVQNAAQVISAGSDMIAVIEGVFAQNDTQQQARAFSQLFKI